MTLGHKTLDDLLAPISQRRSTSSATSSLEIPDWEHTPTRATDGLTQAELVEMFAHEAQKIQVSVHRCNTDEVARCISRIIAEDEAGSVVYADEALFREINLAHTLHDCSKVTEVSAWQAAHGKRNIEAARVARYGITYAESGIAETGSIVQPTSAVCGRALSLLPLVHIAVIAASSIKATMFDIVQQYETGGAHAKTLPSQLCFISGPSATADIELVRVEGVHGPMFVHYVITND